jgi:hypothetical protein
MRSKLLIVVPALCLSVTMLMAWGREGHSLVARVAVAALPSDMPKFFTEAADSLVFLNPEPDIWRDAEEEKLSPALRRGHDSDHFFKLELYSPETLPSDRYNFFEDLRGKGLEPLIVGVLPYRAMELFQRVRIGFRRWRNTTDPKTRRFLEARIIDDSGILGHYIADAAQPLHMSVSSNGWTPTDNLNGYTRSNTIHRDFETEFVRARIHDTDVKPLLRETVVVNDGLGYIYAHMRRSSKELETVYRMEQAMHFGPDNTDPKAVRFVASRLADGASTLRDLWYTAWVTSAFAHTQRPQ